MAKTKTESASDALIASIRKKGGKGKKGRKVGTNLNKCKAYEMQGRRSKNKKRKLLKHTALQPMDKVAHRALQALL